MNPSGWLTLFFVPALTVRYGVAFGTPELAAGAGFLVTVIAVCALIDVRAKGGGEWRT